MRTYKIHILLILKSKVILYKHLTRVELYVSFGIATSLENPGT